MVEPAPQEVSDACLIVPMYNEAVVIADVVRRARSVFRHVICVDDGSVDDSAALAYGAGAQVVRHPSNLGQGAALQTGISYSLRTNTAPWLVTFDADGQHLIADALAMVGRARLSGTDVILGSRFLAPHANIPLTRRLTLSAAVAFTRATTKMAVTDTHNGLRVISRHAAERIFIQLHGMAHASEILDQIARHELTYEEWPVTIRYTEYSRSKGQGNLNAINIAFEYLAHRIRATG